MQKKPIKSKFTKSQIVQKVAQEFVDGMNEKRKSGTPVTIDTLCNFGSMGLNSPRQIVEAFYNSVSPLIRKQLLNKK
jgi:hypothetical protein